MPVTAMDFLGGRMLVALIGLVWTRTPPAASTVVVLILVLRSGTIVPIAIIVILKTRTTRAPLSALFLRRPDPILISAAIIRLRL